MSQRNGGWNRSRVPPTWPWQPVTHFCPKSQACYFVYFQVCQHPHGGLRNWGAEAITYLIKAALGHKHTPPLHENLVSLLSINFIANIWAMSWENLLMPYANNKGADQPAHSRSLNSTFIVHCLDFITSLVYIPKISSFCLASVDVQAGFCLSWSQTPKTGFLVMRFILSKCFSKTVEGRQPATNH